ncbi:MAG: Outer rane receptor protein mostly Fe transport [Chitinophagaceae bacterium]|nr:Outer rane receptor protein mostly Fe transport [Chitinophagaceae bacterium]
MAPKTWLLVLMLTTISTLGFSQSKSSINGEVKDNNGRALQAVTVSLLSKKDSSLIKADISDANGKYSFSVLPGSYLMSYSLVGYEKVYSPVFNLSGEAITLNTVSLNPAASKLQNVTVTSKKPMIEVKADKTIFNVENSINATGSNAMELLQKSPGVTVDNNDNISMKGKTGVKIYIDGKPTQLNTSDLASYLRTINSNDIEAIEIISNPSAKYDASGNAGIVNIRLKKNKKFGTNGSTSVGFVQGVTPKANASVNLNYRDKIINVFGNISGFSGIYENPLDLYRIQNDSLYDQKSLQRHRNQNVNAKIGADYFINSKNTFGILATTSFSDAQNNSTSETDISYKPTNTYIKALRATNSIPEFRNNSNFNVNYRYADTSGTEINFDGDYGLFRGTGRSYQPNYYYDKNGNVLSTIINSNYTPTNIDIYTAKVDAEQKAFKGKFGYGAKFSYVKTSNTLDFFLSSGGVATKVLDRSNSFLYKENVNAAYVNYNRQFNEKISLQAGLRAEQTNSEGTLLRADGTVQAANHVKRNYTDLFPSAALSWTLDKTNALNLTYSRRIDRPTYQDLNPFEYKLDELTYSKGNAFLKPQYTDNVELTHTFKGFLNTAIGYSHVKDYSTEITDTVKNATFLQQRNLATQQILSVTVSSPLQIKKWWNGYVNLWYNYQMYRGEFNNKQLKLNLPTYGAYMQHTFTLGHEYSAEASGWFNGPSVWGGSWKTKPQGAMDLGLQKQLFQKKATVKLSATDIFHTAPWTAISDFGGVYIKGHGAWESQTFRVNFTYRFGSSQVKDARQRKTGLEAEKGRIKG